MRYRHRVRAPLRWCRRLARSARGRALFAVVAVLWATLGFVARLHAVAVPHVTCPEHGEVVELHAGDASVEQDAVPTLRDAPSSHAHDDGCALPPALAALAGAERTSAEVAVPPPATLTVIATRGARPPPLRYAPKTSPPRA